VKNGMATMLDDGFEKIRAGITTTEEVLRVIHD
jgi:type II secretory ATPase GspE/PulE/Tfp pilus assembly ATPase PilB-like protein